MNTNLNNRNINKTYTGNSEKISVIIVDDNEKVIENIDSALSKKFFSKKFFDFRFFRAF